jgi:diaminopimelate epimerase
VEFVKAHGTGNDFVVVEDLTDRHRITPELVRAVCDRHFGVGADGLIRIAPGTDAPFFMDYRNADGSLAEMCGNGVRVVGKYLGDRGLVGSAFDLETRAGVKHLELHADDAATSTGSPSTWARRPWTTSAPWRWTARRSSLPACPWATRTPWCSWTTSTRRR